MSTPAQNATHLSIDQRVEVLEAKLLYSTMPGTSFTRVFSETTGVAWCLALGAACMPKTFFYGPSIEDVLSQSEAAVAEILSRGQRRLRNDWDRLDEALGCRESK